jgi:hypothetical protein
MKDLEIIIISGNKDSLLQLDQIIKLNNTMISKNKEYKFIYIDDETSIEIKTFIEMYNNLVGLNLFDFGISIKENELVYNAKSRNIKKIDFKSNENISKIIISVIDAYKKINNITNIYYLYEDIPGNLDEISELITKKQYNKNDIYKTIFEIL